MKSRSAGCILVPCVALFLVSHRSNSWHLGSLDYDSKEQLGSRCFVCPVALCSLERKNNQLQRQATTPVAQSYYGMYELTRASRVSLAVSRELSRLSSAHSRREESGHEKNGRTQLGLPLPGQLALRVGRESSRMQTSSLGPTRTHNTAPTIRQSDANQ